MQIFEFLTSLPTPPAQILEFLGAAAFSKAVQCVDLTDGSYVCIKIIKNNKVRATSAPAWSG